MHLCTGLGFSTHLRGRRTSVLDPLSHLLFHHNLNIINPNRISAIGKPVKGVVLSLSRSVLFIIPLMLILPLFGGIEMILFAGPIADLLAFLIAVVLIFIEFKKMKPHKE